mmetsp:Transcript_23784/g.70087  ORF Transcript_23784/g.70087 Transcript_23784/m.70087 type:complete len:280 (+) Transcript_23784:262-1101(+)
MYGGSEVSGPELCRRGGGHEARAGNHAQDKSHCGCAPGVLVLDETHRHRRPAQAGIGAPPRDDARRGDHAPEPASQARNHPRHPDQRRPHLDAQETVRTVAWARVRGGICGGQPNGGRGGGHGTERLRSQRPRGLCPGQAQRQLPRERSAQQGAPVGHHFSLAQHRCGSVAERPDPQRAPAPPPPGMGPGRQDGHRGPCVCYAAQGHEAHARQPRGPRQVHRSQGVLLLQGLPWRHTRAPPQHKLPLLVVPDHAAHRPQGHLQDPLLRHHGLRTLHAAA